MVAPNWQPLREILISAKLPHGYWTLAVDYVDWSTRLRIEVSESRPDGAGGSVDNRWAYGDQACTADGDHRIPIDPAKSLMPAAPPGALIAKIGGSSAGKEDGVVTFIAGTYCVCELTEKQRGPLFLAMNIEPGFLLSPSGQILVKISQSG